ncbi:hypothetical protein [Flavobacterium eburneipallidum]|uniref:hypothetical protein n=1 Tax=Flavobacterium eburneipallidum TaxID=3003263 RepID=UPI0022AC39DF|nr:hypothetical protein [Flavobacterium eburneipallidum]
MNATKERIERIKTNGYELDFGSVFEQAFENYKKIVVYAGLMFLVFSILLGIMMMTGLISYIGAENLEQFSKELKQLSSQKVMPLDVAIPFNLILILISGFINPFMAGFYKMANCGEKGEEFHVSNMFAFYKLPYFTSIFMETLIVSFFSVGISLLFQYLGMNLVGALLSLTISFFAALTVPFIVFDKFNAIEAIKSSIIIVSKQPLVLLGLIIVAAIAAVLGFFALCIGIFFTWPFVYSMIYTIYKTVIGLDDTSEITQIGIEQN